MIQTRSLLRISAVLATAFTIQTSMAEDWPQWRGADRSDHCKETGLIQSLPGNGPKQLWLSREAGLGYSGFSVAEGSLYTMGLKDNTEFLMAFNVRDGKLRWSAKVGSRYENRWGDGPRCTPTVEGNQVFAVGGQGDIVAVSVADGKVQWTASMTDMGGKRPNWGYCESLLVDGGQVVCTPGGNKGAMAALDRRNGKVLWQSKDWTDGAQYASIVPATIHGKKQYIQLTQKTLVGIDASNGDVLWESPWQGRTAVIPTPIVKGDEVYIASGYGVGCKKVKVAKDFSVEDVWVNKVMKNHHGGVILLEGHLYGYSDGAGWVCQSWETGEEVWAEKNEFRKGAIFYADGRFYLLEEQTGNVAMIEASSKGWKEHGRFKLSPQTEQRSPQGKIWVHPVISAGKLFLRDQELLFCFDAKK